MGNKNRTVIITGSARGIGFAIAEEFAKNGDQPIIVDLNKDKVEEASSFISEKYKCRNLGYSLDISDAHSVEVFIQNVIQDLGHIDIVVNNAGLQHIDQIENFPVDQWDRLINVMLKGPFLIAKYTVPHMKKQNYGRIINISSVHGRTASPYKCAYIAAKHGVVGLTKTVAIEVAPNNITVNAVMPGVVETPLILNQLEKLAIEDGSTKEEALQKHLLTKQSIKRFIKPEEVAATCFFLASEGASSITGETIGVSGGW